jgi:hypothetical protein
MSMSAASGWRLNSWLRVFSSACPARLQRLSTGIASASITPTTCARGPLRSCHTEAARCFSRAQQRGHCSALSKLAQGFVKSKVLELGLRCVERRQVQAELPCDLACRSRLGRRRRARGAPRGRAWGGACCRCPGARPAAAATRAPGPWPAAGAGWPRTCARGQGAVGASGLGALRGGLRPAWTRGAAPHAEPAGSLAPACSAEGVMQARPPARAWICRSMGGAGVRRCGRSGRARALIEVEAGLVAQLARDLRLALVQAAHGVDEREGEVLLEAQQRRVVLLRGAASPSALLLA